MDLDRLQECAGKRRAGTTKQIRRPEQRPLECGAGSVPKTTQDKSIVRSQSLRLTWAGPAARHVRRVWKKKRAFGLVDLAGVRPCASLWPCPIFGDRAESR